MLAMQRFPSVTVLSERPAHDGRIMLGRSGVGTIVSDEPDVVYVSSKEGDEPAWFGHWPIWETDLREVLHRHKKE